MLVPNVDAYQPVLVQSRHFVGFYAGSLKTHIRRPFACISGVIIAVGLFTNCTDDLVACFESYCTFLESSDVYMHLNLN